LVAAVAWSAMSKGFLVALALVVVTMAVASQAAWSQELGLRYLYFSYAAYCPQSSLSSWNCKWCNTNETAGMYYDDGDGDE
jgi:hypothetical protein